MDLSRRALLSASAALLATPKSASLLGATVGPVVAPTGEPIVLCWNENPYGPSPAARAVMSGSVASSCRYPGVEVDQLTQLLAHKEGVSTEQIALGSGSGELLCALGLLYGRGGGEIVAAEPTYTELTNYAQHAGAKLRFVPVDKDLNHDLQAMRAAVSDQTRAVYICNPNNPTGTAVSAASIRAFVDSLPANVVALVDEAYMDFADVEGVRSVADLVNQGKPVVVLRTFSKIHGMAGVRCGYAIASPEIVKEIAGVRMSSPNIFAMRAARASLGDAAFLTDTRRRIIASRKRITDDLDRLGLRYAHPQTNFVFFDTGAPLSRFDQFMKARNILVGRLFQPYDRWCRITIGTETEVEAFLKNLHDYATKRTAA